VLWTLETPSGQRLVCYAITRDEGLAITIEREGDIVLTEMVTDMDAAESRAIGRAAIYQGYRVAYREAHTLLEEIADATLDGKNVHGFADGGGREVTPYWSRSTR